VCKKQNTHKQQERILLYKKCEKLLFYGFEQQPLRIYFFVAVRSQPEDGQSNESVMLIKM